MRRLRAYTGYDGMIMNSNTAEHLEWHVDAFLLKLRIDEWWNGGGKGATIVDIGAGTGDFTHALAKRVTAYHKVLCVEPNRGIENEAWLVNHISKRIPLDVLI